AEQPSQKRITPTDFEASQLRAVVELLHEPAVPIPLRPERAREREPDRGLQDGLVVRSELPCAPAGVGIQPEILRDAVVSRAGRPGVRDDVTHPAHAEDADLPTVLVVSDQIPPSVLEEQ